MGGADVLADKDVNNILETNYLVLINFCKDDTNFNRNLNRSYDAAANVVKKIYPDYAGIVMGKIYCDTESITANKYNVQKYPTIKLFCRGNHVKDYTDGRSIENIVDFVIKEYKDLEDYQHSTGGSLLCYKSNVLQLIGANHLSIVFVYSRYVIPHELKLFDEAADRIKRALPTSAKVLMGKVEFYDEWYEHFKDSECRKIGIKIFYYGDYKKDYKKTFKAKALADYVIEKYHLLENRRRLKNSTLPKQKKTKKKKQILVTDDYTINLPKCDISKAQDFLD